MARGSLLRARVALEGGDVGCEGHVLGAELLDLLLERLRPLPLCDELEHPAVAEEGAHDQGDEGDDRGQRGCLPAKPGVGESAALPCAHRFPASENPRLSHALIA